MTTAAQTKLLTAKEFMTADLGDGRFDLVRGEVVYIPPGTPLHGRHCAKVGFVLESYCRASGYGYGLLICPVLTERSPDTVRGADVGFYSDARWPRDQVGDELPPVVPNLVVEVYSPTMKPSEIRRKVNEYLDAAVRLVMVVYSERHAVALYRPEDVMPFILGGADVIEDLPELPGFRCPVADLFL